MALANIGLDLLGQARTLLTYAGEVEGAGRTEDDLAYLRDEREFLNVQLVELPNGDFAVSDGPPAAVLDLPARAVRRPDRQRRRRRSPASPARRSRRSTTTATTPTQWVLRLGDGTEESHRRMQAGLDRVWPYVDELFAPTTSSGRWWPQASRSTPRPCARAGTRTSTGAGRGHADPAARVCARRRAAAGAASTPRRSATCWPRCSTCTAPTPERLVSAVTCDTRPTRGPPPPRCSTPRCRC